MIHFLIFLAYLLKFGGIFGMYFVSLYNVDLALILFVIFIGLSIFADNALTQKLIKGEELIKRQQQTNKAIIENLEKTTRDFSISSIIGAKLLEKYIEKTGEKDIMKKVIAEVTQEVKDANPEKV